MSTECYMETNLTINFIFKKKAEVYCNTVLPLEARKISNTKLNLTPKEREKEQEIKPKASRRKKTINFNAEINDVETNKCKSSITDQ